MLKELVIKDFRNSAGTILDIHLSFQFFGKEPDEAPIILVNHALTGNSLITGRGGWWNEIIGPGKCINTNQYCLLAFNIPGNGFKGDQDQFFDNYKEFKLLDIARIQEEALNILNITSLFAIIGGSIGGALAWELAALKPDLAENIIPVATDYKATDWLLANCRIQDHILNNSADPVQDARMHAMTFYRTPQSLSHKFGNQKSSDEKFEVENWLLHHGEKLKNRFSLRSYKLLNHLLTTIDISKNGKSQVEVASEIKGDIHIITVNTDLFFLAEENWNTYVELSLKKENVNIHEIRSIHGHDAFLIETEQIHRFLKPIFQPTIQKHENNSSRSVWAG